MAITTSISRERLCVFILHHLFLLCSLYVMTGGVVLCVRSQMGSSVISSLPLAFAIAGSDGIVPQLTLGQYTNLLNILFVVGQILILRKKFELVQLLQLFIGIVFGWMIDMNMLLTAQLECITIGSQILTQVVGCTLMAVGVAFEVRCGAITMPGEGLPIAVSRVSKCPFAKAKIIIDCSLVVLAVVSSFIFFGKWQWNIIGPGTLFAMVYVGFVVKIIGRHLGWFDRLLESSNGLPQFIYGLARYLKRQ